MNFQWKPHFGPDQLAIERMKLHFTKPNYDPPVMSEPREYYLGLYEALTAKGDFKYIEKYLFDAADGLKNFGRYDYWVEWFLFLFPYLLERILERNILCLTINCFINLYPDEITEEYTGFREDVLRTLPQAIMSSFLWDGNELAQNPGWNYEWEDEKNSQLFGTMFFCLKYLRTDELPSWITSVANIDGLLWKRQILEWIKGLKRVYYLAEHLEELPEPDEYDDLDSVERLLELAHINWNESFLVFTCLYSKKLLSDYIPNENIALWWREIEKYWPSDRQ